MARISRRKIYLSCAVAVLAGCIAIAGIGYGNRYTLSAPYDEKANEAIRQARAIQRNGGHEAAFPVFQELAQQGFPVAMFHTGKAYSRGWGTQPDLDLARQYFLHAARYNYSYRGETAYELGRLFQRSTGPDCNTIAIDWFKKALKWNYHKAAFQLARHHEQGLGTDKNLTIALHYYDISVRSGSDRALFYLARLLHRGGTGMVRDRNLSRQLAERAVNVLERKARKGIPAAAKQLGRIYRKGEILPRDIQKAEFWLTRAVRLGSSGGMYDLARLLLDEEDDVVRTDEALGWLRAAATKGHGGSMTLLGRFHLEERFGLSKAGALSWFEKGAKAEHAGSMEELARIYEEGALVKQNSERALAYALMGSRKGHSGASDLLEKLQTKQSGK